MNIFLGGLFGVLVSWLFIWLFGAFVTWDIIWPSTIPDWTNEERIGYAYGWLSFLVIGAMTGAHIWGKTNDQ